MALRQSSLEAPALVEKEEEDARGMGATVVVGYSSDSVPLQATQEEARASD